MSGKPGRKRKREGARHRSRPLVVHGYRLLVWTAFDEWWRALRKHVEAQRKQDRDGYRNSSAAKLLAALRDAILRDIPSNPGADRYRQGEALGAEYTHWRRDKLFQRFRLFFRYSSKHRIIIYAWLNDERTLRKSGARSDAYFVFRQMLERGRPPDDWEALIRACRDLSEEDFEE